MNTPFQIKTWITHSPLSLTLHSKVHCPLRWLHVRFHNFGNRNHTHTLTLLAVVHTYQDTIHNTRIQDTHIVDALRVGEPPMLPRLPNLPRLLSLPQHLLPCNTVESTIMGTPPNPPYPNLNPTGWNGFSLNPIITPPQWPASTQNPSDWVYQTNMYLPWNMAPPPRCYGCGMWGHLRRNCYREHPELRPVGAWVHDEQQPTVQEQPSGNPNMTHTANDAHEDELHPSIELTSEHETNFEHPFEMNMLMIEQDL